MPFSIDLQNLQNKALRTQPCTQSICKPSRAHVAHIAPKGVLGCHLVSPVKQICLVYSPAVPWVSNSLPNCNCIPYITKFPSWVYWLSADAIAKVRHTAWGELCVETVRGYACPDASWTLPPINSYYGPFSPLQPVPWFSGPRSTAHRVG